MSVASESPAGSVATADDRPAIRLQNVVKQFTANGPVIIDDETEVVPAKPTSSVGILPIILVTVALCAALCGGNDDTDPRLE